MSHEVLLSSNVIIFFILETLILILQFIAVFFTIIIIKNWNFRSTSSSQYNLEKRSYLVTLIIYFTLYLKLLLLPYFTYTIDTLATIVPGAMCGAGVISANNYGEPLLIVKTIILFISLFWIVINKLDISQKDFPFLKKKMYIFIVLFFIICIEYYLEINYFSSISTDTIVSCCSAIFSDISHSPLPFGIDTKILLILFYGLFFILFISNLKKYILLSGITNLLVLYTSYYTIIYFFGTYIYQLPTHHCPFCMLQSDYNYVGYFIFATLFLGTFFGMLNLGLKLIIAQQDKKYFYYSNIFNSLFVLCCSLYLLVYYYTNGVFLNNV